jgi:hypothetical protein
MLSLAHNAIVVVKGSGHFRAEGEWHKNTQASHTSLSFLPSPLSSHFFLVLIATSPFKVEKERKKGKKERKKERKKRYGLSLSYSVGGAQRGSEENRRKGRGSEWKGRGSEERPKERLRLRAKGRAKAQKKGRRKRPRLRGKAEAQRKGRGSEERPKEKAEAQRKGRGSEERPEERPRLCNMR